MVIALRPGRDPLTALAAALAAAASGQPLLPATPPTAAHAPGEPGALNLADALREVPSRLTVVLEALAARSGSRVLVFVDQLEELCALPETDRERSAFWEALYAAGDDPAAPIRVVATLRDDFISRIVDGPAATRAFGRVTILQSPRPGMLREIVTQPFLQAGYGFDDQTLPEQMIEEVQDTPTPLPLLQSALERLWEGRDREHRLLLHRGYRSMGGVAGALAQSADAVFLELEEPERALSRTLLLRLLNPEGTRRIVRRAEAIEGLGPGAGAVVEHLARGRLLTIRRTEAGADADLELVHESLVRDWGRLARWFQESRGDLGYWRQVEQAAELWQQRGERTDELWQGDALAEVLRAATARAEPLPDRVRRFITLGEQRAWSQARRARIRRALGVSFLLITAVVALGVAWVIAGKERQVQRERHETRLRWADSLEEGADPGPPALLSHRGWEPLEVAAGPSVRPARAPNAARWRRAALAAARLGAVSPDGKGVCLFIDRDRLERWDLTMDRRLWSRPAAGTGEVLSLPAGCLVAGSGGVTFFPERGEPRRLGEPATAIGSDGDRIFIARNRQVEVLAPSGRGRRQLRSPFVVTALASEGDRLFVAGEGGSVGELSLAGSTATTAIHLDQAPRSAALRLVQAVPGTLTIGFADGTVGVWTVPDGARLAHDRLHDAVIHLLAVKHRVHAATDLGDLLTWDLELFFRSYCSLLKQVWGSIPVLWEKGALHRRPPPPVHPCRAP